MSIYDISTCLKGGRSCGIGREEDASNLLWCEHCAIALCFDCDTYLHNSKNFKHGHLRVLLPASRTATVLKCEHGADGSSNVRLGLISKPAPSRNKRRSSKKERGSSTTSIPESGRRSFSTRSDVPDGGASTTLCDVGVCTVKELETASLSTLASLPHCEKAPSNSLKPLRSAIRGGYEKAGLGSRLKQHVTWHPDVMDPICSIVSHTVGHKHSPAFLSRRSHQKQLRQKSKASSKSQARAKKQESTKLKKSEPVKARSDVTCNTMGNPGSELVSSNISGTPTDEKPTNPTWNNCTYCIQEEGLCDCVNMPDGSFGDRYLQSVLLESAVCSESLTSKSVQDLNSLKVDVTKSFSSDSDDQRSTESFSEDYRQLLASMFHAASLGQNKTMGSNVKYEGVAGLFRDVEMHAPGVNLSGSEPIFKQASQDKISPWISVV